MDLRRSTRFCVEDALKLLLDGNGPDIDELESDDDYLGYFDRNTNEIDDRGFDNDEISEPGPVERGYEQDSSGNECDESETEETGKNIFCSSKEQPLIPMKSHTFRWRSRDIVSSTYVFLHKEENVTQLMTPFEYFMFFWTEELNDLIAEQTNLYSVQKTGKSIKTTSHEIKSTLVCI